MPALPPITRMLLSRARALARRLVPLVVVAAVVLAFGDPLLSSSAAAATVGTLPSKVTVTATPTTAGTGTPVTLTATVTPTNPRKPSVATPTEPLPTGTITFAIKTPLKPSKYQGLGTSTGKSVVLVATLGTNTATATLTVSNLSPGVYHIYAAYSGNATYTTVTAGTTTAAEVTITTVQPPPSKGSATVVVSASPNDAIPGTSVVLSAAVSPSSSTGAAPTGSVTFATETSSTFVPLGASVALAAAPGTATSKASLTVTSLPSGSYDIYADYTGNSTYSATPYETSQAFQITVLYAVKVTVTATPTPSVTGTSVRLTATVTPTTSSSPTPTGYVTFAKWTASDSTYVKIGTYTCTNPANNSPGACLVATAGTNSSTAMATVGYTSSGHLEVYAAYSPSAPARFQAVTYTSSVSALVTATTPSADTTTTSLTFLEPRTGAAIPFTQIANGSPIVLEAHVTSTSGAPAPSGEVLFVDMSATPHTTLGHATLNSTGLATTTDSTAWAPGTHTVKAIFRGTVTYSSSTDIRVLNVLATPAVTTTTLVASATQVTFGQSVDLTATVAAAPPSRGAPGTVDFFDDGSLIGTATLSGQTTTSITYTPPNVGPQDFTASYLGDPANLSSTSTAVEITVDDETIVTSVTGTQTPSDPTKVLLSA
ncbi:MAG: Ig-like domain-containing protein, partial [Acidimicrobiales bacterium]